MNEKNRRAHFSMAVTPVIQCARRSFSHTPNETEKINNQFLNDYSGEIEPRHKKNCFCHMRRTKIKGAVVIRCLDSIPLVYISKISSL